MGTVYRAFDRREGCTVALKILRGRDDVDVERFVREAAILAELDHPNIVRYADHGLTESGDHYLAMEWLEGEDLAERLARKPLSDADALTVVAKTAGAVAFAHAHGAVHRDIKPSNIFLRRHDIERVTVLDFGIAGLSGDPHKLTQTGVLLGTPGYVAPEQVQGAPTYDPRSDVFSVGCVLFECLVGRPAFEGQTPMAVLAKLMLHDPPRLSDLRPGIAPPLDALVTRMLAKDPALRPAGLSDVAAELRALAASASLRPAAYAMPTITMASVPEAPVSERGPSLTRNELRLVTVVLAGRVPASRADALPGELAPVLEPHGGRLTSLADGSLIITVWAPGTAVDRAERAARCALAVQACFPDLPVMLVTGRGQVAARVVEGDAIDRGVLSLATTRAGTVRVDEATAGMLAARFEVDRDGSDWVLCGPIAAGAGAPALVGPAIPFLGRNRELAMLEGLFLGCVSDPVASAVLITGPAGSGKSRLVLEFVDKLRRGADPVEVLQGRADALGGGAAFGAVADVLCHAAGIRGGDPVDARREKLHARLGRHVKGPMLARVAAFLGEMVGIPVPDGPDAVLVAARANPLLMGDAMRASWEEWLIAECRAQTVVLVLEDLHWGDGATARLIDSTIRNLGDLPFMVIALARVDAKDESLVSGWVTRDAPSIKLGPLPARASEKLVREILRGSATEVVVDRLVEQSGGNPFYLCELIRAVAAGRGGVLPDSVLGLVEARLDAEGADAKRVLRAASVFGDRFGVTGVAALLGGDRGAVTEVSRSLSSLSSRDLVVPVGDEALGASELVFSHALVREAAYAMLTPEDRIVGHRLAGAHLEQSGHPDALALAEHFRRGAEPERAARWYRRAAEKALEANDLPAAIERAERGVTPGAGPEDLGALRLVQAESHLWLGQLPAAVARGREAAALLPPGSAVWYRAVQFLVRAATKLEGAGGALSWIGPVTAAEPAPDAASQRLVCLAECAKQLTLVGRADAIATLAAAVDAASALDPLTSAEIAHFHGVRAIHRADHAAARDHLLRALAGFESVRDQRRAVLVRAHLGLALTELGDFAGAEASLRAAHAETRRSELGGQAASVLHNLDLVLAHRGQLDEARRTELAVKDPRELHDPRIDGMAQGYRARTLLLSGEAAAAERVAASGVSFLEVSPPFRAGVLAVRAQALLALGRDEEALVVAREAASILAALGALPECESLVPLVLAEALARAGDEGGRRAALTRARERLLARAARIADPGERATFLHAVPDNARTMELSGD